MFRGVYAGEETGPGLEAVRCMVGDPERALDPKASFRDVGHALLTLFRVATTDGWSQVMQSAVVEPIRGPISPYVWKRCVWRVDGGVCG